MAGIMPLALAGGASGLALVGVLGIEMGRNLFVAPDGRWIGSHIPTAFRTYPFRLAQSATGDTVLCIIDDPSLLGEEGEGEPFFADKLSNTPSPPLRDIVDALQRTAIETTSTSAVCKLLQDHDLLVPWNIKRPGGDANLNIKGLLKMDEGRLHRLPEQALVNLRDGGALALAYLQLLSQQHVATLAKMADDYDRAVVALQAAEKQIVTPAGELDLEFLNYGGNLNFRSIS